MVDTTSWMVIVPVLGFISWLILYAEFKDRPELRGRMERERARRRREAAEARKGD